MACCLFVMRATQGQLAKPYDSFLAFSWLVFRQSFAGMRRLVDKTPEQKDGKYYRASQQDARVERRNGISCAQLQRQGHPGLHQELPDRPQQRLWVLSPAASVYEWRRALLFVHSILLTGHRNAQKSCKTVFYDMQIYPYLSLRKKSDVPVWNCCPRELQNNCLLYEVWAATCLFCHSWALLSSTGF